MNKTLDEVKLIDLMPESIRYDPKIISACNGLQPELYELQSLMQYSVLYENIDALPESILMYLAAENGMMGPEWAIADTLQKKRELVKNSFLLNKRRGTRWSVERVFEIIGWTVELKEWFEENAEPGTFRVSLLDITNIGMDEDKAKWITVLLDSYKPASRHLTGINLVSTGDRVVTETHIDCYIKMYSVA